MQHLEVSCAVRPIEWPLGVKWIIKLVVLEVKVFLVNLNTQQAHRDAFHKKKKR